jgi:hypothetical protein
MRLAWLALLALGACQNVDVSRTLGARCDLSAECDQKCLAPSTDWPGGFCTTVCDRDADCGDGATCIDEQGGLCAFACASDADCAFLGAYHCVAVDGHNVGIKVMACRGD